METPDKWVVIKISNDVQNFYKIFATWVGGYLGEDSWKLNSGIVKVEEDETFFHFYGASGSIYHCAKNAYGITGFGNTVLADLTDKVKKVGVFIDIMPEDTNWRELDYGN